MRKIFVLAIFICFIYTVKAQQAELEMPSWATKPINSAPDSKYKNESAVYLLDERRIEFADEGKELVMYKTYHKIIQVNDDKGIESFNKVYISITEDATVITIKARTILPNGKIIELEPEAIKDLTDENGSPYKIFALSGLVKGCQVEYYYTFKRNPSFFGREIFQSSIPLVKGKLEIISPERLVFETISFNDPATPEDALLNNKRWVTLQANNIPGAEEEKYSNYTANLKRLEYKLSFNTSRSSKERLFTWNELAKRVHENYTAISDKEYKKIEALLNDMKVKEITGEREKIIAVENYLKKNFLTRQDVAGEDAEKIDRILKNRVTNPLGIMRLYGAVFEKLGIPFQFVLSGDRTTFIMDKSFENWNNSENTLIYFTNQKKYLAPTRLDFRFPWIAPEWGNTLALHFQGTTIGTFKTAVADVRMVNLEDYSHSAHNMETKLKINPETDSVDIDVKQIFTGYSASAYRAAFNFAPADEQKRFLKEIVKFGTNSEHIISSKLENKEFESYGSNVPFIIQANVRANELMEKAGNKMLVKIGEVIGPQVEMYQEKARLFPVEVEFPHVLDRKIEFAIPAGYKVKNLDDLRINHSFSENNQPTMGFVSTYQLERNIVKIHVHEEYRKTLYPLSQYEDFKKVVNAAADFNKIVLVLEREF